MVWQEIGVVAGGILLIGCFIYIGMSGDEISKRYAKDQELRKKIQAQQKRDDEDDVGGGDKGHSSARDAAGSAQQRPNARGAGSGLKDVPEGDEEPGPGNAKSPSKTTARPQQNGHAIQPSKTTPSTARPHKNGHAVPPTKTPSAKSASSAMPPSPRLKPPTFSSMPPPPRRASGPTTLRPPPSSASQLRVPPQQRLSNTSMQPSSLTATTTPASKSASRAVTLTPGHSPLDWAALQPTLSSLYSHPHTPLLAITPSTLRSHTGRRGKVAWAEFRGKVYDIGPYLPFHPGGEAEIMKGAGRGAERLFMEVHPWVNWEGMLGACVVGVLVGDGEGEDGNGNEGGGLEEMD